MRLPARVRKRRHEPQARGSHAHMDGGCVNPWWPRGDRGPSRAEAAVGTGQPGGSVRVNPGDLPHGPAAQTDVRPLAIDIDNDEVGKRGDDEPKVLPAGLAQIAPPPVGLGDLVE